MITLTTDFGLYDGYVAAMKGAILSIAPDVSLVDVSHQVSPQDVASGAYILSRAYRYFPAGAVHLAVVDPGVGSARRAIVVETSGHRFVGPDNGLFSAVFQRESTWKAVEIRNATYLRSEVSPTFHGRDIFGPVAAHLCNGVSLDELGPRITDPVRLNLWTIQECDNSIVGRIVHVDRFGNAISNLGKRRVGSEGVRVRAGEFVFDRICRTYAEVPEGSSLALYGSDNTLEIAINGGNASRNLGLKRGDRITVDFGPEYA
ncbi:MAG: SAM-dependent chlorinase/fluorinase [Gemmatimonadota bacterium]|nr:SAM-dependent chlorinase/fluorinase [Gemmatimonadota bacterium]